ncbi:hypothetical protein QJS66_09560 [Kocuria rhizophila]|nr:hypothetical protein QJS66_09560 [Kocuria rhizophila]
MSSPSESPRSSCREERRPQEVAAARTGAAALAVLTGVSGCAYISPQATADTYAPADGVQMDRETFSCANAPWSRRTRTPRARGARHPVINNGDTPPVPSRMDADGATATIEVPANQEVVLEQVQARDAGQGRRGPRTDGGHLCSPRTARTATHSPCPCWTTPTRATPPSFRVALPPPRPTPPTPRPAGPLRGLCH